MLHPCRAHSPYTEVSAQLDTESTPGRCLEAPLAVDIGGSTVLHNNLGGVGPDSGDQSIRYGTVGVSDGQPFDLLVDVARGSNYSAPEGSEDNGAYGKYGQINLGQGTRAKLRFRYLKAGSMEPVTLPQVRWNFYEFDAGAKFPQCHEMIMADAADQPFSYELAADPLVTVEQNGTQIWFVSTTDEESAAAAVFDGVSVSLAFESTSGFVLEFAVAEPKPGTPFALDTGTCYLPEAARNFLFEGSTGGLPLCGYVAGDGGDPEVRLSISSRSPVGSAESLGGKLAWLVANKPVLEKLLGAPVLEDSSPQLTVASAVGRCDGLHLSPPPVAPPPPPPRAPPPSVPPPKPPQAPPLPPMQPSCLTTPISFGTTTVLTDNLGGVGPSTGDPVIRYGGVGQANGTPFDLVVQVEKGSSYSTPLGNDNGAYGPFGQLNIGAGTRSKLRFSFVKPNSMEEVTLRHVIFDFYDFDTGVIPACHEMMMADTADQPFSYELGADPTVTVEQNGTETWFLDKTEQETPAAAVFEKPSVSLTFASGSGFVLEFAVAEPKYGAPFKVDTAACYRPDGARNFLYKLSAQECTLSPPSPPPPPASPPPPCRPYEEATCNFRGQLHFTTYRQELYDFTGVGVFTIGQSSPPGSPSIPPSLSIPAPAPQLSSTTSTSKASSAPSSLITRVLACRSSLRSRSRRRATRCSSTSTTL